jgi:hypothetical protein
MRHSYSIYFYGLRKLRKYPDDYPLPLGIRARYLQNTRHRQFNGLYKKFKPENNEIMVVFMGKHFNISALTLSEYFGVDVLKYARNMSLKFKIIRVISLVILSIPRTRYLA